MPQIHTNHQEIEYKNLFFPFKAVRKIVLQTFTEKQLSRYCIFKSFNKQTGQVERKYAWESIFIDMNKADALAPLLDEIIQKEYLE